MSQIRQETPVLISASARCQEVFSRARQLSLHDCPVLIQGEYGTQKNMLAASIHKNSRRRNQPFVILNQMLCLSGKSFSEILMTANQGTLLVEHIEQLSVDMQDCLLQLMQHVSSDSFPAQPVYDIRVIATASSNLYELMQSGAFHKNLFFQFSMAILDTVPLKNRREDIPLLLEQYFQNTFHDSALRPDTVLSDSLYQFLQTYDYPGNVQELKNLTQYFYSIYTANPFTLSDLPSYILDHLPQIQEHQSSLSREVLSIIRSNPRAGRAVIQKALARSGTQISDGKLRGLMKELSEKGLILIHRTKGGCEITETGITVLESGAGS
jgi:DNA-binding NtrC family response regulator